MKKNLFLLERIAPHSFIVILDNKNLTVGHIFDRGILKQDAPHKGMSSYRFMDSPEKVFMKRDILTPICFITKRGQKCANAKITYHVTPNRSYNYYLILYGVKVQDTASSGCTRMVSPDIHCFEKLFYQITDIRDDRSLLNLATRASRLNAIFKNTAIGSLCIFLFEVLAPYGKEVVSFIVPFSDQVLIQSEFKSSKRQSLLRDMFASNFSSEPNVIALGYYKRKTNSLLGYVADTESATLGNVHFKTLVVDKVTSANLNNLKCSEVSNGALLTSEIPNDIEDLDLIICPTLSVQKENGQLVLMSKNVVALAVRKDTDLEPLASKLFLHSPSLEFR